MKSYEHRLLGLDFCRCFAAFWVILHHNKFSSQIQYLNGFATWGQLGVDLFFVLSGYLIAEQWFRKLQDEGQSRKSFFHFYIRRAFRIWPNYFLILLVHLLLLGTFARSLDSVWTYFLLIQNFFPIDGFNQSWSLCVEEHFYLIFPALSLIFWQMKKSKHLYFIFFIIPMAGILIRSLLWFKYRPDLVFLNSPDQAEQMSYRFFYFPTWSRMDGLSFGVLFAGWKVFMPEFWDRFLKLGNWLIIASAVSLLAAATIASNTLNHFMIEFLGASAGIAKYSYLPVSLGGIMWSMPFALIVAAALSKYSFLGQLRGKWMTSLALLSYALYLSHDIFFKLIYSILERYNILLPAPIMLMIGIFTAVIGAAIIYVVVERPAMNLRDWILHKDKAYTPT